MIDTYTSSKGEKILIAEMASPHLIHSIAKLSRNIEKLMTHEDIEADEEMLKALKAEAISRLSKQSDPEALAGIAGYFTDEDFMANFQGAKLYEFLSEKFIVTFKN